MTDSYSDQQQTGQTSETSRESGRSNFRGGRGPGNREQGGFRIRLSDNEMRNARSIQEAFNLRSTVAVLGFALRTLGQMLEDGKLDELVAEHRSQSPRHSSGRGDRPSVNRGARNNFDRQSNKRDGVRPNPFARPPKPESAAQQGDSKDSEEEEINVQNISSESNETTPNSSSET